MKERKKNIKINRVSFYWAIQNLELGIQFNYFLIDLSLLENQSYKSS